MTQVWELSDKDFKAPLIMMIHEVRVNTFEINRMIDIFVSKEIEGIPKNQRENFELISTITEIKSPLEDLKSSMEMRKKRVNECE